MGKRRKRPALPLSLHGKEDRHNGKGRQHKFVVTGNCNVSAMKLKGRQRRKEKRARFLFFSIFFLVSCPSPLHRHTQYTHTHTHTHAYTLFISVVSSPDFIFFLIVDRRSLSVGGSTCSPSFSRIPHSPSPSRRPSTCHSTASSPHRRSITPPGTAAPHRFRCRQRSCSRGRCG